MNSISIVISINQYETILITKFLHLSPYRFSQADAPEAAEAAEAEPGEAGEAEAEAGEAPEAEAAPWDWHFSGKTQKKRGKSPFYRFFMGKSTINGRSFLWLLIYDIYRTQNLGSLLGSSGQLEWGVTTISSGYEGAVQSWGYDRFAESGSYSELRVSQPSAIIFDQLLSG